MNLAINLPWKKNSITTNLGVYIGTENIKLAQVQLGAEGQAILNKIVVVDIPQSSIDKGKILDPNKVGEVIRTAVKSNGLNSKNVVMGIAGRNVIIRQVKFPLMQPDEIRESLKWEVDRYLPVSLDDSIVDFHILRFCTESDPPELEVVLVGVNKALINSYIQVAEKAEVKLQAVDVSSFAFLRALNTDNIPGTIVAINAGKSDFEMDILHDGLLKFTRVISNGPLDTLIREIQRSINFYHLQNRDVVIEKIILAGDYPELTNLADSLEQELNIKVERANPYSLLEVDSSFDPVYLDNVAPLLGVSIGLALKKPMAQ